jgi:hypothetical protein
MKRCRSGFSPTAEPESAMTLAKTAKIPEARKSDLKSPNRKDLEVESLVLLGALGDLGERIFRKSG